MEKTEFGQRVINAVREVAAEDPSYVFTDVCRYVDQQGPACIVGHALWNLGLIDSTFYHDYANDEGIDCLLETLHATTEAYEMSENEADWLKRVQDMQDSKTAWGTAVSLADDYPYTDAWMDVSGHSDLEGQ